jgi:hypothetical protein
MPCAIRSGPRVHPDAKLRVQTSTECVSVRSRRPRAPASACMSCTAECCSFTAIYSVGALGGGCGGGCGCSVRDCPFPSRARARARARAACATLNAPAVTAVACVGALERRQSAPLHLAALAARAGSKLAPHCHGSQRDLARPPSLPQNMRGIPELRGALAKLLETTFMQVPPQGPSLTWLRRAACPGWNPCRCRRAPLARACALQHGGRRALPTRHTPLNGPRVPATCAGHRG